MFDLTGKVALITGAGSGTRGSELGAGVASVLAGRGARILVNDLRPERAEATVAAIEAEGGVAAPAAFDITDFVDVRDSVAAAEQVHGRIDILINNVGAPDERQNIPFRDVDLTLPSQVYVDLNLYGVLHCARAVLDGMTERRFGRIIVISSGAALQATPVNTSMYAAGKGGALAFMRQLAYETAPFGVTANAVAWGRSLRRGEDPASVRMGAVGIPVGRFGEARDLGALCTYLASDEASWLTGQTIGLNGGSS